MGIKSVALSARSHPVAYEWRKLSRRRAAASKMVQNDQLQRLLLWIATAGTAGSGMLNIYSVIGEALPARHTDTRKVLSDWHLRTYRVTSR